MNQRLGVAGVRAPSAHPDIPLSLSLSQRVPHPRDVPSFIPLGENRRGCKGFVFAADRCGTVGRRMTQRVVPASDNSQLDHLCRAAEDRVGALGHVLGAWTAEGEVARRAVCTRCGRAVYVRAEGKLGGVAGRACGEPCDA
jgi:hypothetical protein